MAGDDHDETFDNVTIQNSITDPSGTTHTDGLSSTDGGNFSVSDETGTVLVGPGDLLLGDYLTVTDDGDGTVTIHGENTNTNTHLSVENDDGVTLVKNPDAMQAGDGLSFSDDGDNTATLNYDGHTATLATSGVATLSNNTATISTGITSAGTHLDVALDPSGGGANAETVKVAARAVWNDSAGEYEVEIVEDGTSVGDPDVGYQIMRYD